MNQLELFNIPAPAKAARPHNPFAAISGVNLFGQRALFTGFCDCTGGDLLRLGYAGGEA